MSIKEGLILLRKNAGLSLFGLNVVLLVLIFLSYDPLGIITRGYSNSPTFTPASQDKIERIEIISPARPDVKVSLVRRERLTDRKKDAPAPPGLKKKNRGPRYAWQTVIETTGKQPETHPADRKLIQDLFRRLGETRRYYSIPRGPEKDREFELGKNEKGEYHAPRLVFTLDGGKKTTLYLGKSRADESYVRRDEEDKIFLVESDLKTFLELDNPERFRNRALLPAKYALKNLDALEAEFAARRGPDARFYLRRADRDWTLQRPVQGKAKKTAVESLLGDILKWRAVSFPGKTPPDLDRKAALVLKLHFKTSLTGRTTLEFRVLGRKGYSDYYIQDAANVLYKVNSIYLSDLYEDPSKLLDRGGLPGRGRFVPPGR